MKSFQQLPIGHKGLTKMILLHINIKKEEKRSGFSSFGRCKGKIYKSKYKPFYE